MATYSSALTDHYYLKLEVTEQSYSVANNTSTLAWRLYVQSSGNGYYFSTIKIGAKVTIDGTVVLNRAYSSSSQYSCAAGGTVDIASGTTTVPHNSDGTKTIAAGAISASNTTQTGAYCPNMSLTSGSALTLTAIPRASAISISTNSSVMGVARTITISRASSSFTHTLTYSFGSASGTIAAKTSSTSVSFTPPTSLASQLTNAKSGTGTITCETFSGNTSVGTSSISFTGTIPVSTASPANNTTTMGTSLTFNISRAASNLTHSIEYKFGSQTEYTAITGSFGASFSFTSARGNTASLASLVSANNASGAGTMRITTYNGTATVGTSTASFTLKIPASTFTRSSATLTMGNNQVFTITRAASNITHKLTYSFGSTSGTIGTGIGTSKTWTVPTSLASQLSNASNGTCTVTLTTYNGTAVCGSTSTVTFTATAPVSTMTLSSASVYIGTGSTTVTINRASTNMTHTLEYKFSPDADSTYASIGSSLTTTATWSPAYSLANKIPSAASGSWTLRLTTKIGTATVGTSTKTLTLKVPNNSTTQPTISSSTLSPSSSLSSPFNTIFIANYTKLKAVISASGKYSATISTYAVSVGGVTQSGSGSTQTTTDELPASGTVTVTTKVTDSRGFTKSSSQNITVYEYAPPSVIPDVYNSKVVCARSNSSGTLRSDGTYLHIEAGRTISSLAGNNKGKLTYEVFDSGGTSIGTGTMISNRADDMYTATMTSASAILSDLTSTYTVVLTATDDFGNSSTYRATIPTDSVTVHFKRYGTGIGVGMYSQGASRLDVGWSSYFSRFLYGAEIASRDDAASGGKTYTRLVPAYDYTDLLGGTADSFPYGSFLEAWLKQVVTDNPQPAKFVYWGAATPNGSGIIMALVLNSTDLANGLPKYSGGVFIPNNSGASVNRGIVRFGSYNGAFYVNNIPVLESSSASVTYVSNSIITSSSNLGMTLRKSGNVVTLDCQPTFAAVDGGTTPVTVATLPSGYLPQSQVVMSVPGQGSSSSNYMCSFYALSGGDIRIYKHNTSTATYRANLSWITA